MLPAPLDAHEDAAKDRISVDWRKPLARFRPADVFGIAIDGGTARETQSLFLPANRRKLSSLRGLRISYRLRTELGIEAWHWTSHGQWSDPRHQQGYWTGDPGTGDDQEIGYGYRLPRRGDTHDEANEDGYSRIDDGNSRSFWKSNPYLDQRYTGMTGEHADWVVAELPRAEPIDAISILWSAPFARDFQVQYWVGADEYEGRWVSFPTGSITSGHGGRMTLRLAASAIRTRFVRLLMTRSSHQAASGATDPRDAVGYAISEIALGRIGSSGGLIDLIHHSADPHRQTIIHVSSTDPWHRAVDRDTQTAQPSLAALHRAGIIGDKPVMLPSGVLYDNPDNMIAMLAQLERQGIKVDRVELGEEPDGQLVSAEDYGALYIEFARRIRSRFPTLRIGGPSLVNGISDTWLDPSRDESWTSHFIQYLKDRHALGMLDFFSYEYFPFDDVCGAASTKLLAQTVQFGELYQRLTKDQVPVNIPWLITESGYSAFGGAPLVQMPSALVTADAAGDALRRGGSGIYTYGFTPDEPIAGESRCAGQGNLMFWLSDRHGRATSPMPSLRALTMLTRDWAPGGDQPHTLVSSASSFVDRRGRPWVSSYPLILPDGRWSVLLVNRSARIIDASLDFSARSVVAAAVGIVQYSARQYRWDTPMPGGRPSGDVAPVTLHPRRWSGKVSIPPLSISVVQGTFRS